MPSTDDLVAVLARGTAAGAASRCGTVRSRRPQVDHHRPAQRAEVDVGAAAEAGQRHARGGRPRPARPRRGGTPRPRLRPSSHAARGCRRRSAPDPGRGSAEPPVQPVSTSSAARAAPRPTFMPALGASPVGGGLGVGRPLAVRRAEPGDRAGAAGGLLGVAAAAAVPDQVVAEHGPVALGEQCADRVLDLDRVGLVGPAEPARPAGRSGCRR